MTYKLFAFEETCGITFNRNTSSCQLCDVYDNLRQIIRFFYISIDFFILFGNFKDCANDQFHIL